MQGRGSVTASICPGQGCLRWLCLVQVRGLNAGAQGLNAGAGWDSSLQSCGLHQHSLFVAKGHKLACLEDHQLVYRGNRTGPVGHDNHGGPSRPQVGNRL